MILRSNHALVQQFLADISNLNAPTTLQVEEGHLITLLTFVGDTPFSEAREILTNYKAYLHSDEARRDGKPGPLSPETIRKNLDTVREYLTWLQEEKGYGYKISWINKHFKLTASERNRLNQTPEEDAVFFSPDEIVTIARTPVSTLVEERTRMSCVFLWLTGMRSSAFTSLPREAVDLEQYQVRQWTKLGVRTKLSKSATTPILNPPEYPELIEVLYAWERKIQDIVPPEGMWYANISPQTGEIDPSVDVGEHRSSGLRKDLILFLEKAGIAYKSLHKFRHGFIRFLRDQATSVDDLEAIANSAMQTVPTMLKYGKLGDKRSREIVANLCNITPSTNELSLPTYHRDLDNLLESMDPQDRVMLLAQKLAECAALLT